MGDTHDECQVDEIRLITVLESSFYSVHVKLEGAGEMKYVFGFDWGLEKVVKKMSFEKMEGQK